ncbi:MAG: bifunctional alpha,alpha-trehalose-phosphate synthase (UDP-forming)/trehalose-phosphatase [Candidatus Aminicenantaceae bacterium]
MQQSKSSKDKLFIIANRLPVGVRRKKDKLYIQQSPGGLATALRTLQETEKPVFIGWPGILPNTEKERKYIKNILKDKHHSYPVFLSPIELEKYYHGFANKTIWPLFHYFSSYSAYEESEWEAYKRVNQKFFKKVSKLAGPRDIFWIHDYHLMLLPSLLRKNFPNSSIGFFLHIPFPSSEIFRLLPWRKEILEGLLGADLIGFHTYEYARHFLSCVLRLLGYDHDLGSIIVNNRIVKVENFPLGIDFQNFENLLEESSMQKEIIKLKELTDAQNRKIILSVDRLDYTKGIPQRLKGIEFFLEKNPKWHGRFSYIVLSVPSRTKVSYYAMLKQEVDRMIGQINGRFGRPGWIPIHYMYRSLPFNKLLPLYVVADVALITPLRDGMNLVAKEYVAAKKDNKGVLVLSETAGASSELGEALLVNVNNKEDIAEALLQALEMSDEEQESRIKLMRKRLFEYDIYKWTESFLKGIEEVKTIQNQHTQQVLSEEWQVKLVSDFKKSKNHLLLLDYDGTLISFALKPEKAKPDTELLSLLLALAKSPQNKLVIISGRDTITLERWLGKIPCILVAEHGAWIKSSPHHEWEKQGYFSTEWKDEIKPVLKTYEVQVPGSFVEEKEYGVAWHYRKANPELGKLKSNELYDHLNEFLASIDLQVMHGNKVIEVRCGGINKGEAAKYFLSEKDWGLVLAMGDDWTDEDMFKVLPLSAYSINVGYRSSSARFYLESPEASRNLLRKLAKI